MIKSFKALSAMFSTKAAKLIVIVIVAGLMATSSAAVYTQYYANTIVTVGTANVVLSPGADTAATNYPVATVDVKGGTASVGITLFPAAKTTYTNVLEITNNEEEGSRTIKSISVSTPTDTPAGTNPSTLGATDTIKIYLCSSVTDTPQTGCLGSGTITNALTAPTFTLTTSPTPIDAGDTLYIAIVGSAAAETTSNHIDFQLTITWA